MSLQVLIYSFYMEKNPNETQRLWYLLRQNKAKTSPSRQWNQSTGICSTLQTLAPNKIKETSIEEKPFFFWPIQNPNPRLPSLSTSCRKKWRSPKFFLGSSRCFKDFIFVFFRLFWSWLIWVGVCVGVWENGHWGLWRTFQWITCIVGCISVEKCCS